MPNIISLVKRKTDYNTKISELKKKVTDHNHDKYFLTPEFNTLDAYVFNARLAQANLITKTDFKLNLIEKLPQIKQNICLLKMNLKSKIHLIQFILEVKVT